MRNKLLKFIEDLERKAKANAKISKEGSPVTSMAEDSELGAIAKEQQRVAKRLREIINV